MKLKARLFLIWVVYATLLVVGSRAYEARWAVLAAIYFGSLFGMVLPKLICVLVELLTHKDVQINASFAKHFFSMMKKDSHSLVPQTKTGQMLFSYPFLFAFGIIALYVVTSTDNWFGKALVLGMGLRLIIDLFVSNRDKAILKQRWFSVFHARLSDPELDIFVYASMAAWALLTIFALRS